MKKFRIISMFLLTFMLLASYLDFSVAAHAVEVNGVRLGPSIVDQTVKPGESFEQIFQVHNQGDEIVSLEPYLQDYRIDNGEWIELENPDSRWSPMTWGTIVSFPEHLAPGESGDIQVKFDLPESAEMGEHMTYFSVKFIPDADTPAEGEQSTGIVIASQIRSIVYIKVTDALGNFNLEPSWHINKATVGFWNFNKPVFTMDITNDGNVHLEARGTIELTDTIRNQKTELNVPLFNILPDSSNGIQIPWEEAPFIGYYTGRINLTYDGENFEQHDFSFVTIPLFTLLGSLSVLAAIILAVVFYIRKLQKRLSEMEQNQNNNL